MNRTNTAQPDNPAGVCAAIINFATGPDVVRYAFNRDANFGLELLEHGASYWKAAAALDESDRGLDNDPQLLDDIASLAVKATACLAIGAFL